MNASEMRQSKPGDLILAATGHIPFTVTEVNNEHVWGIFYESFIAGECCRICGIMRRRDRLDSTCKGPFKLSLRGEIKHAD